MIALAIPNKGAARDKTRVFLQLLGVHLRQHWFTWLLCGFCYQLTTLNYRLVANISPSLHQPWFLVHLNEPVHRSDFVAFRYPADFPYPRNTLFGKRVAGVPGDRVTRIRDAFYINGNFLCTAQKVGLTGRRLEATPVSPGGYVLGADEYFVVGDHPYSVDSRYAFVSWIKTSVMVGRAHALAD